jgi:hypothetical protein
MQLVSFILTFRKLSFILKTKYTLRLKFVPAQVRSCNNHWSTSRVRLIILNYRTLEMESDANHAIIQ